MLSSNDDNHTAAVSSSGYERPSNEEMAALVEVLQASPGYVFSDFLTSPYEDSPLDDFLTTPIMGGAGDLMTNSPAIAGYGDEGFSTDMALFPEMDYPMVESSKLPEERTTLGFEELIKMSPPTPSLDPSAVFPSPVSPPLASMPSVAVAASATTSTGRRRAIATGTRKNITPDALVSLDAPTQKRSYISPSATSRKEIPAVFARKRARSQAFPNGDDEDELEEIVLGPNPTEAEQIEAKRRQNTIAARRSRKRKLAYTRELEEKVECVTEEKDLWKNRALACEALLKHHGLEVPEF